MSSPTFYPRWEALPLPSLLFWCILISSPSAPGLSEVHDPSQPSLNMHKQGSRIISLIYETDLTIIGQRASLCPFLREKAGKKRNVVRRKWKEKDAMWRGWGRESRMNCWMLPICLIWNCSTEIGSLTNVPEQIGYRSNISKMVPHIFYQKLGYKNNENYEGPSSSYFIV